MSASAGGASNRTKDGVPIWDGEAGTFNDFEEACLMHEQSVAKEKRYLCGPKIVAELTGAARRLVTGKGPTWISYNGGVQELLRHLRACLGKPQISELSEFLNKYFKHSRRRPQETINDYVTRKCEVYLRAQQALRRVAPHHAAPRPGLTARTSSDSREPWWTGSRRSSIDSTDYNPTEARSDIQSAAPTAATNEVQDDDEGQAREEASEPGTDTPLGSHGGAVATIHGGTTALAGGATQARTQRLRWRCQNFFLIMYKDGTFSTTPA